MCNMGFSEHRRGVTGNQSSTIHIKRPTTYACIIRIEGSYRLSTRDSREHSRLNHNLTNELRESGLRFRQKHVQIAHDVMHVVLRGDETQRMLIIRP
jgi:hypothetical protein